MSVSARVASFPHRRALIARRGRLVLVVWLAAAAAGLFLARGSDRFQTDVAALVANLEAARADRLIAAHFGGGENETLLYCVRSTAGSARSPANDAGFQLDDSCALDGPIPAGDPVRQVDAGFLSATPRILLAQGIDLARSVNAGERSAAPQTAAVHPDSLAHQLRRAEFWSLLLTAAALLLCYRSVPIALLAIGAGGTMVAVTLGLLTLIARETTIPFVAVSVASLLALALGADLASLTALAGSEQRPRARRSALAGCGGIALVFALFALFPPAGLRALALVAAVAAIVALAGAWTLIPGLYAMIRRVMPVRQPIAGNRRGLIGPIAGLGRAHPLCALAVACALLMPAGVGGVGVLRDPGSTLPRDALANPETARAQLAADTELLLKGTVEFVLDAPRGSQAEQAVARLLAAVKREPLFAAPVFVQWSSDGEIAAVTAFAPAGDAAHALAAARRAQTAASASGPPIAIGGPVMLGAQVDAILRGWSLWAGLGAAGLAAMAIAVVFGSPVLALTLLLGALLAALAGLGVLDRLIAGGWTLGPFALAAQPALDPWTPLIVVCLVIAISTSYAALVLGQLRVNGRRREPRDLAFVRILREAPQLTSAAALSMLAIGFGFTAASIPAVQQAGLGLALALAIEATLVRGVLTPAALRLIAVAARRDAATSACDSAVSRQ